MERVNVFSSLSGVPSEKMAETEARFETALKVDNFQLGSYGK